MTDVADTGDPGTPGPSLRDRIQQLRSWKPSLRSRILVTFGFGALVLSALISLTTYNFAKSNLLDQRDQSSVDRAYANARRTPGRPAIGADEHPRPARPTRRRSTAAQLP